MAEATAGRQREFAAGRRCALRALERAGIETGAVGVGVDGAPVWPAGVIGSITHCERFAAAAVTRHPAYRSMGIDAELHAPLPSGVLEEIATEPEMAQLRSLPSYTDRPAWDRVLFSVKEAIFKAWYPLGGQILEYREASVLLLASGKFRASVEPADGRCRMRVTGRFLIARGLVLSAVLLKHGNDRSSTSSSGGSG